MSSLRSVVLATISSTLCVVLMVYLPRIGNAQTFGGSPPWGLEKPVPFSGETRQGETFEYSIGNGLALKLAPTRDAWEIEIGPSGGTGDYASCENPPFHGPNPTAFMAWHFEGNRETPGAVGEKRWIDFVLTAKDSESECRDLDLTLKGKDSDWGSRNTGRCWLRPISVKLVDGVSNEKVIDSLKFDGECALHGAWELWRLPATYVIPTGFTGWVTVFYRQKGRAASPRDTVTRHGTRYVLSVTEDGLVRTSSDLREDRRGATFSWEDGRAIPTEGRNRMIWGWEVGPADFCGPYQSFFVGTGNQYTASGQNPIHKNLGWDCSGVVHVKRQ